MQVIHSVKCTDDEIDGILAIGKRIGEVIESTAYSSEEKAAIVAENTKAFSVALNALVHEAFAYGYNEGLAKANVKDTEMYKPKPSY